MDEKRSYLDDNDGHRRLFAPDSQVMHHHPIYRSRRKTMILLASFLVCWVFLSHLSFEGSSVSSPEEEEISWVHSIHEQRTRANSSALVPLEAHIMSKCPDAKDCLRQLVVPAMEKIVDMVDFNLSFIGSINADDTIQCKHGETECLGNMLSLCAKNLFPNSTIIPLGFTTCMVSSYPRIPDRDLVENCALEHGIEFDALNACVSDNGKGLELLRDSVERSEAATVTKSCTLRVAGKIWCIRDGGEWKGCDEGDKPEDLVAAVHKIYNTTQF